MVRYQFTNTMYCAINETRQNEEFYVREIGFSGPPAGHKTFNVLSPIYAIHYVTSGQGTYNNQHIDASRGFLIAINEPYSFKFDETDPWQHYWICVGGTKAPEILASMGLPPHNHVFTCDYAHELADDFRRVLYGEQENMEYDIYMMGVFYKAMAFHASRNAVHHEPDRVGQYCLAATRYIHDNYCNSITVEDVAAAASISSKYLYKLFCSRFGMPPSAYIASYRMERARQLLAETNLSVSEIARSVGYDQPNYFTNSFRKRYGISPSAFRENQKPPRSS